MEQTLSSCLSVSNFIDNNMNWFIPLLFRCSNHRLERLKRIRWQLGAILPAEVKCNLSEDEIKWFASYSRNLSDYMNHLNDNKGIDLTLMRNPPKKLYIQVRCISDYGQLELDDGHTVVLSKDSMVSETCDVFDNKKKN